MSTSFLHELRRRKVVRVGIAYAIAAFIVLQVADLVLEPLGVPPWAMTLVIVLVALGFLPALILAWVFDWTPDGVRRTETLDAPVDGIATGALPDAAAAEPSTTSLRWPLEHRLLVAGAVLVLALAGGAFLSLRSDAEHDAVPLDAAAVAVLPFRVAAEPSLGYLGHGMVDLLAAKLTGEGGPRAIDSRSVLRLWDQATAAGAAPLDRSGSLALARSVGAGHLLLGEIVGAAGQVTVSATLHDVAAGSAGVPVTVVGPVDSLPWLVDNLVAQLLSVRAGEDGRRLAVLTSASLPALRAYLAGKAAYRSGRFADAAADFRRAVEIDSTFALAGFELVRAAIWAEGGPQVDLGTRIAWLGRDRLPARERRRLELDRLASFQEVLRGWEALISEEPADAEAWFELGEWLLHHGPDVGYPDALGRALHAFERSVAIDSIYAPALYHAIEIHARRGDSAQVRRLASVYFHRNAPESGYHSYIGWRTALALDDQALLATMRAGRFDAMPYYDLGYVGFLGQTDALPLDDVELALAGLERRAGTSEDRDHATHARVFYLLNAGRPVEAERVRSAAQRVAQDPLSHLLVAVRAGTFWSGDASAAATAAAQLERYVAAPPPADADSAIRRINVLCALEERRLAGGDASRTDATLTAITNIANAASFSSDEPGRSWRRSPQLMAQRCAAHVAVLQAAIQTGDPSAPAVTARLATLDSLLGTVPGAGVMANVGNLIAARLHASRGDPHAALHAVRRRSYWGPPFMLSPFLLEEAALAEQIGDTDAASQAYAHYLHLRAAAEPALRDEVEHARRNLDRLQTW